MSDRFWEIIKSYIPQERREEALNDLEQAGVSKEVNLPGFGKTERESRQVITDSGEVYSFTPHQMHVIINIASYYPKLCSHKDALRGTRLTFTAVDKYYLRVVLSKIRGICPKINKHIRCEKWSGYRWIENPLDKD